MRYRNFTINEAGKLDELVTRLLPTIQGMPFGKRIKAMKCEVDDNADVEQGFPEIRVRVDGKLTDKQTEVLCALATEFPEETVEGTTCGERLGVRTTVQRKLRSTVVSFRWTGLRKIDVIRPLDIFYSDGTFSSEVVKDKIAEGVVYYVDEKEIRIVSPKLSGKLPWAIGKLVMLSPELPEINPFGIFELDQSLADLGLASKELLAAISAAGLKRSDFPAIEYVDTFVTECVSKGNWHLPLPGDAAYLFSREQRGELSKRLRQFGGRGLSRSCWLGVEYGESKAYMVQLTTANAMIKTQDKIEGLLAIPVARLTWESIENL